jgi:dihydroflavonol-4-reductase
VKVLLTGATGMMGSNLAHGLVAAGHDLRCLIMPNDPAVLLKGLVFERVEGDILNPESLAGAVKGIEAVVHTAGMVSYWNPNSARQWQVNVEGTRTMLDAAVRGGVRRFLLTSSIAALGYVEDDGLGDEETAYNWGDLGVHYCDSKHRSEELVLAESRIETLAVNPGIVFGERDLRVSASRMLVQARNGGPTVAPPGRTTVCTARDMVSGHLAALDRGRTGERYVLGGHTLSFLELFQRIAKIVDGRAPTRVAPRGVLVAFGLFKEWGALLSGKEPDFTRQLAEMSSRNRQYSSAKAERELGFSASELAPCLERTWAWLQKRELVH